MDELFRIWQEVKAVSTDLHIAIKLKDLRKRKDYCPFSFWSIFSNLPHHNCLALPIFYDTIASREFVLQMSNLVRSIDQITSGGNLVFQGVVGVGKTTLLRFSAMYSLFMLDVLVVYWDYQSDAQLFAPGDLLLAALQMIDTKTFSPVASGNSPLMAAAVVAKGFQGILFNADEINTLYIENESEKQKQGKKCISQLLCIGKTPCCLVFATGSSSQLRSRVFPKEGSLWHMAGYVSLNHSVFTIQNISPIRTVMELEKYYVARFKPPEDKVPVNLLMITGGVGRLLEAVSSSGNQHERNLSSRIKNALERPQFRKFASLLFTECADLLECTDLLNPRRTFKDPNSIPAVKKDLLFGIFNESQLDEWEDSSLIFRNDVTGNVELLIPLFFLYIYEDLHRDAQAICSLGLRVTINGWKGHGSPGAAAEPMVCHHVVQSKWSVKNVYNIENQQSIVITNSVPSLKVNDTVRFLSDCSLQKDLCKRIIIVNKDTGIDGFEIDFEVDEDGICKFHIRVFQIKLGEKKMNITPGSLETQRKNLMERQQKIDDGTIAGIIVKGEKGIRNIFGLLKATWPAINFIVSEFLLVTNKRITPDGLKMATQENITTDSGNLSMNVIHSDDFYAYFPEHLRP